MCLQVFLTPTHLAIVMEYASGGELFDRIVQAGRFVEDEARYFFQQLISGVHHCHCSVSGGQGVTLLSPFTSSCSCQWLCHSSPVLRDRCTACIQHKLGLACCTASKYTPLQTCAQQPYLLSGFKKILPVLSKILDVHINMLTRTLANGPQGVCHRDLKLENTLLDGNPAPRLKICDFGYSKV